ncbi:hypothetical protein BDV27DRAFT_122956 [Aspergillus caelatus]|uniref:Uncharacterized protein n=1 Tax=Aspergillus caelatus TaxID=61420 RepID=A0A5N7AFY9_9EURO|nr:uncharacterized protein BDV27DRAFT_122956 [Aspergillus caelatus]KAE8368086.1 hypothetical protein BDV27DRAFT_122956 [Aspergillus caelatus]
MILIKHRRFFTWRRQYLRLRIGITKSQFMLQRGPHTALNRVHTHKYASTPDGERTRRRWP